MRSVQETIDYLNDKIKHSEMTKAEVLKKAGLSLTVFTMAQNRNNYLKVESLERLGKILNISVAEILGLNEDIPEDIQHMIKMLKTISPENRKMIAMNIENYYQVEIQNRESSSS